MSYIRADVITAADGTSATTLTGQVAAKSWINFTSYTTTSVRASFNISSVTDNSAGNQTLNFTNAFVDTNYAPINNGVSTGPGNTQGIGYWTVGTLAGGATTMTTSALRILCGTTEATDSAQDSTLWLVTIHR